MDSQNFNPKEFVDEVQTLCDIARLEAGIFADDIGDKNKLNQCLEHIKYLTTGLTREDTERVFAFTFLLRHLIYREKNVKDLLNPNKSHHSLKEKKFAYYNKIIKAINLIKNLNPDPSKFDENYLLNLAMQTSIDKPTLTKNLYDATYIGDFLKMIKYDHIMTSILNKKKNPKGSDIINTFIITTYKIVKNPKLTENAFCARLAPLLIILTEKKYRRQDIQGILYRYKKII